MHGDGDQACGIVSLDERLLQFVDGHTEVVERLGGVLLQLVAEAPEHHRRGVAVAAHPLGNIILPQLLEGHPATRVQAIPLVVELVDDEDSIFVAELDELTAIGVVAGADVVHAKLLHELQPLLDGTRIVGGTERT